MMEKLATRPQPLRDVARIAQFAAGKTVKAIALMHDVVLPALLIRGDHT